MIEEYVFLAYMILGDYRAAVAYVTQQIIKNELDFSDNEQIISFNKGLCRDKMDEDIYLDEMIKKYYDNKRRAFHEEIWEGEGEYE